MATTGLPEAFGLRPAWLRWKAARKLAASVTQRVRGDRPPAGTRGQVPRPWLDPGAQAPNGENHLGSGIAGHEAPAGLDPPV